MALSICALGKANAQTWDIGTPTATDVTATLNNGTLTISGIGDMQNWNNSPSVPWHSSYRNSIISVVIDSGVTNIGNFAFSGCSGLISVAIPNSVTTIGVRAFLLHWRKFER